MGNINSILLRVIHHCATSAFAINLDQHYSYGRILRMKAVLLEEFGKAYVRKDMPVPDLEEGMMLVRVKAAGFCHTDLLVRDGAYAGPLPMIPGHENVGVVEKLDHGVQGFQVGDRVGLSVFRKACGLNSHGGMAQYILADPNTTVKLPDELFNESLLQDDGRDQGGQGEDQVNPSESQARQDDAWTSIAPLMCAGSTVYNSLLRIGKFLDTIEEMNGFQFIPDYEPIPPQDGQSRKDVGKGRLVGIIGTGGLGHLGVQFAKILSFKSVALDIRQAPLDLVRSLPKELGADLVLNAREEVDSLLSKIAESFPIRTTSNGRGSTDNTLQRMGLDAALVCSASLQAYQLATSLLCTHGVLVAIGQPEKEIPFHWRTFVAQDITVIPGCLGDKRTVEEMLELICEAKRRGGGIKVEVKAYDMGDFERLIEEFEGEEMKGRLVMRID